MYDLEYDKLSSVTRVNKIEKLKIKGTMVEKNENEANVRIFFNICLKKWTNSWVTILMIFNNYSLLLKTCP